jgi:hypothetical protein
MAGGGSTGGARLLLLLGRRVDHWAFGLHSGLGAASGRLRHTRVPRATLCACPPQSSSPQFMHQQHPHQKHRHQPCWTLHGPPRRSRSSPGHGQGSLPARPARPAGPPRPPPDHPLHLASVPVLRGRPQAAWLRGQSCGPSSVQPPPLAQGRRQPRFPTLPPPPPPPPRPQLPPPPPPQPPAPPTAAPPRGLTPRPPMRPRLQLPQPRSASGSARRSPSPLGSRPKQTGWSRNTRFPSWRTSRRPSCAKARSRAAWPS